MIILVQDKVIETKGIADIVDIEANKKMFLNREAGFKIILTDNRELIFKENISYDSYPSEIARIKNKWSTLMDKVVEQWQSDKTEIKSFKL